MLFFRRMYGLIFENLRQYVIVVYGEDKWEEIRRQARVEQPAFTTHDIYPDNVVLRIVGKGCKVPSFRTTSLDRFRSPAKFSRRSRQLQ